MERVDTSPAGRDTLETLKLRLFSRNEKMISHCSIGILTSTICLAVNELQLVCMLTLTKYNPVVADLQTLPSIQQYGSYVLLDFDYPFTLWFLLLANCAVFLAYLFPITSNKLNSLLSLLITTVSYLLTIPSLFLSSQALQTASSYIPPIPLLLLCLINNAIFHSLHFECSIDRAGHNAMIRQAGSLNR